jgi:hypothetical protein
MIERIEELNRGVLELEDSHPAKQFLEAFMDCVADCAGREIGWEDQIPIEQEWISVVDGRNRTFSGFVYQFLCYDIVLDGILQKCFPTDCIGNRGDQAITETAADDGRVRCGRAPEQQCRRSRTDRTGSAYARLVGKISRLSQGFRRHGERLRIE